jgi:hypothetical protein
VTVGAPLSAGDGSEFRVVNEPEELGPLSTLELLPYVKFARTEKL